MKEYLQNYTLAGMEQAFNRGLITEQDRDEYIAAWNECPGRFTVASLESGAIRQREKK